MEITAQKVNELRQITGAGMMDCKKALVESAGDIEAAIDFLRKQGQKVSAKRADKEATEGSVFVYTNPDSTMGIAFALNCETDFVARNDEFQALGNKILQVANLSQAETKEQVLSLNIEERAVSEHLTDLMGKIGEKIEISAYSLLKGEKVVGYIHSGKIAVLVSLKNTGTADAVSIGKDVCMQIAAMNPVAVSPEKVPSELVEREKAIGVERARQEGKPEAMLEKIAEGFVKKFYAENTLLNQPFVKEAKMTVAQYLDAQNKGMTVANFVRIGIGR
jgi:elongation factor Ts